MRHDVTFVRPTVCLAAAALLLTSCADLDLWPSTMGEPMSGGQTQVVIPPSAAETAPEPVDEATPSSADIGFESATLDPPAPATPTGTFVGTKVVQQQAELAQLDASTRNRQMQYDALRNIARQNSQSYFASVAAITARLRVGTTPGNPVLVSQWNAAQNELDRLLTDIAALSTLGNQVATDSAMAAYLLESVRATYALQGAVDEDHRQLALIEDGVNRTVVSINRTLGELQETINRYTDYVNAERRNLTTLALAVKNGDYLGPSLTNRSQQAVAAQAMLSAPLEPQMALAERRPLVVIRFNRPDIEYRQALYSAISTALDRRPSSGFDLIAVAPMAGSPADVELGTNTAKRNANDVLLALTEMGLPSNRVTLSATTSPDVLSNEVRIYVR